MSRLLARFRPGTSQYNDLVIGASCYGYSGGVCVHDGPAPAHGTMKRWLARARAGEEPYRSWWARFRVDVERARRGEPWKVVE